MLQDNPLLAQLKQQLHQQMPRVEGIVKATDKSFGFLEVDSQQSYFIAPMQMKKVMHGDKISAVIHNEEGKDRAEPEELLEPALTRFVGQIHQEGKQTFIKVEQSGLNVQIPCYLPEKSATLQELNEGDWYIAELTSHPLKEKLPFSAQLQQLVAHEDNPKLAWLVTLSRLGMENDEPSIERYQWDFNWEFIETETRRDLTGFDFVTIDNESTQDMDDALFIQRNTNGSWELLVAIADPSSYIEVGSTLDLEAKKRAFTTYLPGMNIPMLPRILSDDLCSLLPNERRPALVCRFTVKESGELMDHCQFFTAWIQSKEKLSYDNVSDYLERNTYTEWQPSLSSVAKQLRLLAKFYQSRHFWRKNYAVIFKDKDEIRFVLNEHYQPVEIKKEKRRIANNIVEEAMICANICAANFLNAHLGFGIFNTHAGFDKKQIKQVVTLLLKNRVAVETEDLVSLSGFAKLQREFNELPQPLLEYQLRRFQTFSEINTQPAAHFGLGLPLYATWTSPIRKYGDLINHRLLKSVIQQQPVEKPGDDIIQQISERRRLSRIAEREVNDWLYCQYLQKALEKQTPFIAEIIDVTRGGLRVKLIENGAVAFIPLSFLHEERNQILCQPEQGKITVKKTVEYTVAQQLMVILADIRINTRNIIARPESI